MSNETPATIADLRFTVEYDATITTPEAIAHVFDKLFDDVLKSDSIWPDAMVSDTHGSPGVGRVIGRKRPDDLWADDPEYPQHEWRLRVYDSDTVLGYWDWVEAQKANADDGSKS